MDPFTRSQIREAADGPLAEMGFTNPIEVAEWWQYGLRYRNGLRAIDFVIDVEFGSIFVVFIRTLKSDKAADLLSLDNGHPMELAMACRASGIEYAWTPAKITSEQWQSQLPRAISYDLQKLIELMAREGAWDRAIEYVAEYREREMAWFKSGVRTKLKLQPRANVAPPIEQAADQTRQTTANIEPTTHEDHPLQRRTSRMTLIMGAVVVLLTSLYSCSRENW